MLENTYVFILSNAKYDAVIESTGYTIAKHLAVHNKVFYIEYPATLKDYYQLKTSPSFEKKKDLFDKKSDGLLATENPNLNIIITPLLLSINVLPEGLLYRKLLNYNERIIANRIKKVIKKFNIEKFVFINSFNFHYPNIGKMIAPNLNVYHCVDPIVASYDIKHGHISEEIILKNSDLVVCTSKELYQAKSKVHPQTFFIPNAADFEHSEKAGLESTTVHPDLQKIKKPVIGYFGNIERRVDYDLLKKVMKKHADKSFAFVGPIEPEYAKKLNEGVNNVYLLPRVAYKNMPSVIKGFDVAIIPFKKDEVSFKIFPLKLFEYLGSGKPVISTNFNTDLKELTKDTVPYCANADEFSDAINEALYHDTPEKLEQRIAVARENTWERRAKEFSELLEQFLEKKDK